MYDLLLNSTGVSKMVPIEDISAETDSAAIHAQAQVNTVKFKGQFTQIVEFILFYLLSVGFQISEIYTAYPIELYIQFKLCRSKK